jgi:CDP-diacylglycerol--glycerol-3-phosphate 3-phosphatidyltransferase
LEKVVEKKRISFSDRLRIWFKWLLDPLGTFFNRLGIHPNLMTLLGLFGTAIGALLVAKGQLTWGGLLILLTVPFDALDGSMARALVFLAAAGTVLVSYSKAKADALKFDANVGLLTRAERYLVLAPALVFRIPIVALWILAVLTNFTALQRILHVRQEAYLRLSKKE